MIGIANTTLGNVAVTGLSDAPAEILWGCHDSPLGPLLMGVTHGTTGAGLCRLEFVSSYGLASDLKRWKTQWPSTVFTPNAAASAQLACQFRNLAPSQWGHASLMLYGTEFQLRVWKALMQIKPGQTKSYDDIASLIGQPGAAKAVGLAVGSNPIPILVPCHRVSGESALPADKKLLLLALEDLKAHDGLEKFTNPRFRPFAA